MTVAVRRGWRQRGTACYDQPGIRGLGVWDLMLEPGGAPAEGRGRVLAWTVEALARCWASLTDAEKRCSLKSGTAGYL
eukprot:CAMPEP_0205873390 /NCGR_PEP_ID=MMETSP1083-20121108/12144_1 /ASSEMBLY_ACC=CAM_ASM_000430 /TAXON_ID=97485 /ORGANISM="Prymnesium parvum, Strain Texoma1" /LENGTH=77 /DNA_ID=CAMNT_0053235891 /DNA_START=677 /DNA_END=908 /DNA_ORIENTATION=-